jgi:hypothetical protein
MAVFDDAILPINDVSFHPSMFFPALRMQLEAVRVEAACRGCHEIDRNRSRKSRI